MDFLCVQFQFTTKRKEFLLSRIVIDSWPFNNEVGKLLVELEEDFNSLTRKNIKMSKLKF